MRHACTMQKDKTSTSYLSLTKPPVRSAAHLRKDPRARFLTTGGMCTIAADVVLKIEVYMVSV